MPNEPHPNDLGNLWQEQETEKMTITLDELKLKATRFDRRIHWRNLREYVACFLVMLLFAARLRFQGGWHMVSPLLLIAGTLYVMFQIHLRAAKPVPGGAGMTAYLDFHRRELARQRDALRSVWRWYLMPLVPGLVAGMIDTALTPGGIRAAVLSGSVCAIIFGGVWKLNDYAAGKLDKEIQALNQSC